MADQNNLTNSSNLQCQNQEKSSLWIIEHIRSENRWEIVKRIRDWDKNLFEHSLNVASYARALGEYAYGYSKYDLDLLVSGAFLHDAGKTNWPIQFKTLRPLGDLELYVVKSHPITGKFVVEETWPDAPLEIFKIIIEHHERVDGTGYPMKKTNIHEMALITAAADIFAAIWESRAYREHQPPFPCEAVKALQRAKYDDKVIDMLVEYHIANVTQLAK